LFWWKLGYDYIKENGGVFTHTSLNPCFGGSWVMILAAMAGKGINVLVLILVLVEVGL